MQSYMRSENIKGSGAERRRWERIKEVTQQERESCRAGGAKVFNIIHLKKKEREGREMHGNGKERKKEKKKSEIFRLGEFTGG